MSDPAQGSVATVFGFTDHTVKQLLEISVVRPLFEPAKVEVLEVIVKHLWQIATQLLYRALHFEVQVLPGPLSLVLLMLHRLLVD